MQGRYLLAAMAASMLAPSAAFAAEPVRRPVCPKIEPQRVLTQHQQRARAQECRTTRMVPPVVDPTPFFLL